MEYWRQFLARLGTEPQVFVVGPRFGRPFQPLGPTIYVDGGVNFQPLTGGATSAHPTVTVGDGDSTQLKLDVPLPKKKDFSDLAFVLQSLPPSVRHVELLGFLGGRRDHELINYGEVHKFLRARTQFTTVRFDDAVVAFFGGSLKMDISGIFSLIVFERAEVTIRGAAVYALENPAVFEPASSVGLSNVGNGSIVFESSAPCFLFLR